MISFQVGIINIQDPLETEFQISLGVVDGGPRHLRRWRWSESASFGSLVSPSQAIS